MSFKEFELIDHYFSHLGCNRSEVIRGIGDDCAILQPSKDQQLVMTIDTLVENIHFLPQIPPHALGYKALAVSLSDIAAMGAEPTWVMLALTLSQANPEWLNAFCEGFNLLLTEFSLALIGGNTSRGNLSVTTQVTGQLPSQKALRRDGAKVGDLIYVTGTLGDAGLGLQCLLGKKTLPKTQQNILLNHFYYPPPRISAGKVLRDYATAAIDISDGLAADLEHILTASRVGATIQLNNLPLSEIISNTLSNEEAWQFALTAGEDYELCFTVPAAQRKLVENLFLSQSYRITCIGEITANPELQFITPANKTYTLEKLGYEHIWNK